MTSAAALYKKHSKSDLLKLHASVSDDPRNRAATGLLAYTAPAMKRLRAIEAAVAMHMADDRVLQGRPVPVCGYSGRKSNRA